MTKDNVIDISYYQGKARPGARAPIILPEHEDYMCVTEKTQTSWHADNSNDHKAEMEKRIKESILHIRKKHKAYFCIYGRDSVDGIVECTEYVEHIGRADMTSTPIYKLLRYSYGLDKTSVRRIVDYAIENRSIRDPMATIGDGESLVYWKAGQAYIDVYSEGLFTVSPKVFISRKKRPVDSPKHQGMIRYLMRTSGVQPPEGKISFSAAGMKKLREIHEFKVFDFDMKLDASKVAKPQKSINIIRITVGGSAVGKTKRVHLLTKLFGVYGTCNGYINDAQFATKERPLVVCGIDEATRMGIKGQKGLERKSTMSESVINQKYEAIMTWNNPTFYWITANQMSDPELDLKIVGEDNQRWMVRQTIGGAKEFAEDVAWGIDKDGDDNYWTEEALAIYTDILKHFYDPDFQAIGTPENCKEFSNAIAYERHIQPLKEKLTVNSQSYALSLMKRIEANYTRIGFLEFRASHQEEDSFTASTFAGAFSIPICKADPAIAIGKFLRAFRINTGIETANPKNATTMYKITDWELFEKAVKDPTLDHLIITSEGA